MTDRQREIIDFIAARLAASGRAPTYREIATTLPYGHSTISRAIDRGVAKGLLAREPHCPRGLALPVVDLSTVPLARLRHEIVRRETKRVSA